MNVGQYNKRITFTHTKIDRSNVTTDRWGQEQNVTPETPTTFQKWASVLNKSQKYLEGKAPTTTVVLEVRCHYSTAISDDMQVTIDGVEYEIDTLVDFNFSKMEYVITLVRTQGG